MTKNKERSKLLKKNSKRPVLMWSLALLAAVIISTGAYFSLGQTIFKNTFTEAGDDQTINLAPPTEADRQEADENKDRLAQTKEVEESDVPSGSNTSSDKKQVKPTITEASRSSIRGYITGIFEEGGICTATFTKDGQTLSKTSAGFQNASYTQCAPIDMPSDFLSVGKWAVTLSYDSAASHGDSEVQYIE